MEIMETEKIVNLLNCSDNEDSNFATKKWYIIDSESKGNYLPDNRIKFVTNSLGSSLCDYSDAHILVTGNITVTGGNANTKVAFKNCAPFKECRTEINEAFVGEIKHINIAMPMYNLIEYSDSYPDTSVEHSLKRCENCILSSAGTAVTFEITETKLYVPVVTLKTEDNVKLSKLLNEGFKRLVYQNKYKIILEGYDNEYIRERLDASIQGVSKLFVLAYARGDNVTNENSYGRYFLPRLKIKTYNFEIDGRNFYDQPINDLIKHYDEVRKISTGQGDDCTTGCLLDFGYFEKKLQIDCSRFK